MWRLNFFSSFFLATELVAQIKEWLTARKTRKNQYEWYLCRAIGYKEDTLAFFNYAFQHFCRVIRNYFILESHFLHHAWIYLFWAICLVLGNKDPASISVFALAHWSKLKCEFLLHNDMQAFPGSSRRTQFSSRRIKFKGYLSSIKDSCVLKSKYKLFQLCIIIWGSLQNNLLIFIFSAADSSLPSCNFWAVYEIEYVKH